MKYRRPTAYQSGGNRTRAWALRVRERLSANTVLRGVDMPLAGAILGLVLFGLIALSSASSVLAYKKTGDSMYYVVHQLFYGVVPGLIAFAIFARVEYRNWQRLAVVSLLGMILLLLLPFVPGVQAEWGTARSWVALGPVSFQPSELAKLACIIFLSAWFAERGTQMTGDLRNGLFPFACIAAVVAVLLGLQPDFGTLMVFVCIAGGMYLVGGAKFSHVATLVVLGLGGITALTLRSQHTAQRLTTFLHPELDPQGIGYQVNQALLAIGSGGVFGLGYGQSRQKFSYLPEVMGDSIFAVISEELGLLVALGVVAVYLFIVLRSLGIAKRATDPFARFLIVGIMSWFGFQAFFNIGAMVAILPLTGIPLPLISYGGTSMVAMLAALGIVVNISKHAS